MPPPNLGKRWGFPPAASDIGPSEAAALLVCYGLGKVVAEKSAVETPDRKNWNPESFLWFSAAARTRALSLEVSGDVARTEFTMSKDFVETLSRRVQRLKFQRFEAKDPIHILQIQMCARCGLVASAFKICAEARGSRRRLHTLGKPATGCKHTSKKVPVKKVVTWKDFCSFVRSIRMLRRSRGVSGMFLTKVG